MSDVQILPKIFTGKPPFSESPTPVIISKIMGGERPVRPQEAQELGLADSLWNMTARCWHQDPAQRPTMTEVVGLIRELLVASLSIEADINDFLQAYKTWGRDDQGEKAQEFVDRLDEVRRDIRRHIIIPHHAPRFLTMQIFANISANNISGTYEGCAVSLMFFHPRSRSRRHLLTAMLLPSPQAATRPCTRQPFMTAPL